MGWMFDNCKKMCGYCVPGHPGRIIKMVKLLVDQPPPRLLLQVLRLVMGLVLHQVLRRLLILQNVAMIRGIRAVYEMPKMGTARFGPTLWKSTAPGVVVIVV